MRTIFALLFILLRLILWPFQCFGFWLTSLYLICSHYKVNVASYPILVKLFEFIPYKITKPCHSIVVVTFFVVANLLLTMLQYYWGVTIFGFLFVKKPKEKAEVVTKKQN